jgi:hypothetical protein
MSCKMRGCVGTLSEPSGVSKTSHSTGWAGYNVESHFRVTSQSPRMIDIDVKSLFRWSRRGGSNELAANFQLLRDRVLCPPHLRRSHEWRARHRLIRSARSRSSRAATRCRRQKGRGVGRQGGRRRPKPRVPAGTTRSSTAPPDVNRTEQNLLGLPSTARLARSRTQINLNLADARDDLLAGQHRGPFCCRE